MEWKAPLGLSLFVLSFLIGTQSDMLNAAVPNGLTYTVMIVVWITGIVLILSRVKDWYASDLQERVEDKRQSDEE